VTRRFGPRLGIRLAGSGAAFPSEIELGGSLSNADMYRMLLGDDAESVLAHRGWHLDHPSTAWGVERREWIRRDPSGGCDPADVVELASEAARRGLWEADLAPAEVDLLVAATSTPPRITSTLAASIGQRLGVTAPCLDVRAGGAGGLAAWLTASRFVGEDCRHAVVVAVETPSLYVGMTDLATALLFGDGSAALVLRYEADAGSGLLGAVIGRGDAPGTSFTVPGSLPPTPEQIDAGRYRFRSPDRPYLEALARSWAALCEELRRSFPEAAAETDSFLPYAVTVGQVRDAAVVLGVSDDQTVHTLAAHGCLGCPGPLVGLDRLRRDGGPQDGRVLALAAVAGGVTSAGMFWQL